MIKSGPFDVSKSPKLIPKRLITATQNKNKKR